MTTSNAARTAIVTGATSGLGYECVGALLREGWHVVMAVRDVERGHAAAARLGDDGRITVMRMDLASLASVRAFVAEYDTAELPPTRAVICNARASRSSRARARRRTGTSSPSASTISATSPSWRDCWTASLLPRAIVVVSSGTHDPAKRTGMPAPQYASAERLAHPEAQPGESITTLGRRRYTTSKLCNVLFAYELDRRLRGSGADVTVNVFDPGLMPGSGLARDYTGPQRLAWRFLMPLLRVLPDVNSTRVSGSRLAALVDDARFDGVSGQYFSGLRAVPSSADSFDRAKASDLWNTSERLIASES